MMIFNILLALMGATGLANAIETHGGIQFDVRWTNDSEPLDTPIKDSCKLPTSHSDFQAMFRKSKD